jgi:hypothetical protein
MKEKEELKVGIITTHNGKEFGHGFDFSSVLNEGKKLTAEYVYETLCNYCRATTRKLQRMKLTHPYEG